MKIDEALILVNNLDYEEGLKRKFSPRHSLIQLHRSGEIVAVYRFKNSPNESQYTEAMQKNPGTVQIPAVVGTYPTVEALQAAIDETMWLFDKMKKRE
ncbi:MAG: hypothetical protein AB2823_04750 [Candidatus Thiodiazotropha endolucinida]